MRLEHNHRPAGILPPCIWSNGRTRHETNIYNSRISHYHSTPSIPMPLGLRELQRLRRIPPRANDALFHHAHKNSLSRLQFNRPRLQPRRGRRRQRQHEHTGKGSLRTPIRYNLHNSIAQTIPRLPNRHRPHRLRCQTPSRPRTGLYREIRRRWERPTGCFLTPWITTVLDLMD